MAKNLLVSIVAFVLCVTVLATEMVVKQKNGENWRINVNEVEEIIFDESIPEDSAIVDTSVTPLKFKILSDSTVEVINDDSYREDAFPESITIPAKVRIEGKTYNVISIGDYAFRDCNGLISIKIPNSVSSIGNFAFYRCSSLISVKIPERVTSIGNYSFSGCSNLDVTIDNSKDNITLGYDVFYLCKSVTYLK